MAGFVPDPELLRTLEKHQRGEITECQIYRRLAMSENDPAARSVLYRLAEEELEHYKIWKQFTGRDMAPSRTRIWLHCLVARVFGVTFAAKIMEAGERRAQAAYRGVTAQVPGTEQVLADEAVHERELVSLIDEERLRYVGAVVLGLNDALVEFTGMLAGLTFAIRNPPVIAVAALITGVAAALSMAASEYLSLRSERGPNKPLKAAAYTGVTYLFTVALLILPFLVLANPVMSLIVTLIAAVVIIFLFTFYIAVAKDLPFWQRFSEMAAISLGIAGVSFAIGLAIRVVLNVNL
ncbi:MAG TPA: VIT1/CCC1 transporter family protein [Methanoregula sp.]|nr:VIT1/CCC1 transporter family protein [Methanoregula sp.]